MIKRCQFFDKLTGNLPPPPADNLIVRQISDLEPTILYVDDQPSHRLLFEKTFQGTWLVLTASSAEEGLKILNEHDVFLVVADHNMPVTSGVDFLVRAKEVSPQTIRAVLSAYADGALRKEAIQKAGAAGFFEKPWDRRAIRGFIEASFLRFLHGGEESAEAVPENLPPQKIGEMMLRFERHLDEREAERVFLTFTEPPIRDFVPTIYRPVPEPLAEATIASISGKVSQMERAILEYLRQYPEGIRPLLPKRH